MKSVTGREKRENDNFLCVSDKFRLEFELITQGMLDCVISFACLKRIALLEVRTSHLILHAFDRFSLSVIDGNLSRVDRLSFCITFHCVEYILFSSSMKLVYYLQPLLIVSVKFKSGRGECNEVTVD